MKKNLFFLAAVPFVALLAGCPNGGNGIEGEGEGAEGEGEGEGEGETHLVGTFDIQAPDTAGACDIYLLDHELDYSTIEEFDAAISSLTPDCPSGAPCTLVKTVDVPTHFHSYIACGSDHLAVGIDTLVDHSGTYQVRWTDQGQCGLAPNGTYVDQFGDPPNEVTTTTDGTTILIDSDTFTGGVDIVVTGDTFGGLGSDRSVTGTISDNLCVITYHQECSTCDPTVLDLTLTSTQASCQ